uniref:Ribosomal protein L5 n=1 Tax=Nitzschia alba TaxID=2858 RepID=A0A2R4A3D9_NITAL|nr:ribosomal protein L5 [Nitzschia alba]AVR57589.1 ribosomal protein L5 [Nitzschia alba]
MSILENYYKKVIQYDLINKFFYTHLNEIPQLKKIILNFGCKHFEVRNIASALLSLELVTMKQGSLVKSKRSNILLKIRKGNPVGCVVVLKKNMMYTFLFKLLSDVFPSLKDFKGISVPKKLGVTSFSFTLKDLISFKELEKQFYLFINLPPLNVTLVTNTKTKEELLYLLRSFKLPLV